MIYTVTFNPSLDYVIRVTEFKPGKLHRTQEEELFAGGKGINVSSVLKELGTDSIALGFTAGFTGKEIIHRLKEAGISSDFITVSRGISRINIKLKSGGSTETEINGQGPVIGQGELKQLYEKLNKIKYGDFLVLSGNVPKGVPDKEHVYEEICRRARERKALTIIDAEGDLLRNTLGERPFLIKPNRYELEKLFGKTGMDTDEICSCAGVLQAEGARNVLISLAEEGAVLLDENGTLHIQAAPKGTAVNSTGAGDSLLAGFLAQLCKFNDMRENKKGTGKAEETESVKGTETTTEKAAETEKAASLFSTEEYEKALRFGVAAGSAGAFSTGLPERVKIDAIYDIMKL